MPSIISPFLMALFLISTFSLTPQAIYFKRTCKVSLALKVSTGDTIVKDVPGYFVSVPFGMCSMIKSVCPGNVKNHIRNIYGSSTNPINGETAVKLCELFKTEVIPPTILAEVEIRYSAEGCSSTGSISLGKLCCFKCKELAESTTIFYYPIIDCSASAAVPTRPDNCNMK